MTNKTSPAATAVQRPAAVPASKRNPFIGSPMGEGIADRSNMPAALRLMLAENRLSDASDMVLGSPDGLQHLLGLLNDAQYCLPAAKIFANMAKKGFPIKPVVSSLRAYLSSESEMATYAALAITHFTLNHGNFVSIDSFFFSSGWSAKKGTAQALKDAAVAGHRLVILYLAGASYSDDGELRTCATWAIRTAEKEATDNGDIDTAVYIRRANRNAAEDYSYDSRQRLAHKRSPPQQDARCEEDVSSGDPTDSD